MYISDKCEWTPYGTNPELDKKVDSDDYKIRAEVARQSYGLDKLINDKDIIVRYTVAEQGYGLDKLINDKDTLVCNVVNKYLINHNYKTIFDWANDNNIDIDIDEWLHSDNWKQREQVAKAGYRLDVLINDEDWEVREAVALQGYGLDKLINDKKSLVRGAVAHQGYGLDILINDEDECVREAVALQGYGLDKLINAKNSLVRGAVAHQGYGLDKLVNDKQEFVRKVVRDYLKENGYKSIEDWAKANPNKVHGNNNFETTDTIKDFIYKIDESNTLKVESSYESCEAFFDDDSKESFESNESIVILAVDKKIPLIKLEKVIKDENQVYKFIVDITNEEGDDFIVRSIISSKDKFNQLLESTINALNEYPQFSKYTDDLENCI